MWWGKQFSLILDKGSSCHKVIDFFHCSLGTTTTDFMHMIAEEAYFYLGFRSVAKQFSLYPLNWTDEIDLPDPDDPSVSTGYGHLCITGYGVSRPGIRN